MALSIQSGAGKLLLKVSARREFAPDNVVGVWRLDSEEMTAIRRIATQAGYPYNFGPEHDLEHDLTMEDKSNPTSLDEFLRHWEEFFPFAQTDLVAKWGVDSLSAEAFHSYIDVSKLNVPGTLSAVTTAKLIIYCLLIMEAAHEALQTAGVSALRFSRPDAQDILKSLASRAADVDHKREGSELVHSVQFSAAILNPIVREAVNNAAINRWGLSPEETPR
jgi:hypothetical protein